MNRNPPPQLLQAASLALSDAPSADAALLLGQILVQGGRLAPEDVDRIVDVQREKDLRFGQAGQRLGLLTSDDLRYGLSVQFDYPYLGPDSALDARLVAAHQPDSAPAEQWRALRSELALRWLSVPNPSRALAVVSPDRREGRSLAAANLAIAFSQLGQRTLLIDADLRQPRQQTLFGLSQRQGLSDWLAGRVGQQAVCAIEGLRCLSVLPAGTPVPNPQELLARPAFDQLLQGLAQDHAVVILDTPAASQCADAQTVAVRAGAALLLARRHASSLPRLAQLRQGLGSMGVTLVGSVLQES
jgi:chain length determinant protein tyrosine kinase EpsG